MCDCAVCSQPGGESSKELIEMLVLPHHVLAALADERRLALRADIDRFRRPRSGRSRRQAVVAFVMRLRPRRSSLLRGSVMQDLAGR